MFADLSFRLFSPFKSVHVCTKPEPTSSAAPKERKHPRYEVRSSELRCKTAVRPSSDQTLCQRVVQSSFVQTENRCEHSLWDHTQCRWTGVCAVTVNMWTLRMYSQKTRVQVVQTRLHINSSVLINYFLSKLQRQQLWNAVKCPFNQVQMFPLSPPHMLNRDNAESIFNLLML